MPKAIQSAPGREIVAESWRMTSRTSRGAATLANPKNPRYEPNASGAEL